MQPSPPASFLSARPLSEAMTSDASTPAGISCQLARKYRVELQQGRSNSGSGPLLQPAEMVTRIVGLRRRNSSLAARYRLDDKKMLDGLEKNLPKHVTDEADRVIGAITAEVRAVGNSVAAVHDDLRSFIGGKVVLSPGTSPVDELAAIS